MKKIKFTHNIIVPNNKNKVDIAEGYAEEMMDVTVFPLSQEEYDDLREEGGLFDLFDSTFGTIIDDCEEDRLSNDQVIQAIELIKRFLTSKNLEITSGIDVVLQSLEFAKEIGVFWEIINGTELCE